MLSILPLILVLSTFTPQQGMIVPVTVTAYEPVVEQTDNTPFITASNKKVRLGIVALSRDLEKKYNFKFGDVIFLQKHGAFIFEDRMNSRWKHRVDIFVWDNAEQFGVRKDNLILIK